MGPPRNTASRLRPLRLRCSELDMNEATFRFYADLNDFLQPQKRGDSFTYPVFDGNQTVKHLIESQGIPHTEVDLILVNGRDVDFGHIVRPGERIAVYPPFTTLKISRTVELRPPTPVPARFLLDNHLGRLARYLRLLGFDTQYFNNQFDDRALAELSHQENRILLTRDRGLLKRRPVEHGYCLRTKDPQEQLKAVILRYRLADEIDSWKRCLRCNGMLQSVTKKDVMAKLEPKTMRYFNDFQQCQSCTQVYWQGSHFRELQQFLDGFLSELRQIT